jgi:hypothetical protein
MENLITPLDRAHRVLPGTKMEHFEQVPRRIAGGITRICYQLHLRRSFRFSVLCFAHHFKTVKTVFSHYSVYKLVLNIRLKKISSYVKHGRQQMLREQHPTWL